MTNFCSYESCDQSAIYCEEHAKELFDHTVELEQLNVTTPDKRLDQLWDILRSGHGDPFEDPAIRVAKAMDLLRSTKNDSIWTPVECLNDVPVGVWLFKLERNFFGTRIHTGQNHPNGAIIAGVFGHDIPQVVAYAELPK